MVLTVVKQIKGRADREREGRGGASFRESLGAAPKAGTFDVKPEG